MLALIASLGIGCQHGSPDPDAAVAPISSIELKSTSYWTTGAHAWRVVFKSDLTCEWSGLANTERMGEFTGTLQPEQWGLLELAIDAARFEQCAAHYDDSAHDAEHLIMTVTRGAAATSVDDYNGAGPAELHGLHDIVRRRAASVEWQESPQ